MLTAPEIAGSSAIVAICATAERVESLTVMLRSLAANHVQPAEIVIVDASASPMDVPQVAGLKSKVRVIRARTRGAASQRNEGIAVTNEMVIWFLDDDVILKEDCAEKLWQALLSAEDIGG